MVARPSRSGHIVTITCSGRAHTWLSQDSGGTLPRMIKNFNLKSAGSNDVDFDLKMFEVCHKPNPGTDMTFAYFHLLPYLFVKPGDSFPSAGIETNMAREFARKYNLNMKFFDAKYVWGAFDKNLSRWNGVVGHTLYGDVDVGMCNIDTTYVRYRAVDYSTYIRFASLPVIMTVHISQP